MGQITDDSAAAYRDYNTEGVPGSGAYEPEKSVIRPLFALIDSLVAAAGGMAKATVAQVRAAVADVIITADHLETASALVALTDAATIAVDWDSFINGTVTLGDNRTLGNPTNGQPGTWRTIIFTQDGTGSRTLALDTQYATPGGTLTLTTTAGAVDVLSIFCRTATSFYVFPAKDLS